MVEVWNILKFDLSLVWLGQVRLLKTPSLEFRGLALLSTADYLLDLASKVEYVPCEHVDPRAWAYLSPIKDDILDDILQSSHVLQFALLVREGPVIVDGLVSELSVAGFHAE